MTTPISTYYYGQESKLEWADEATYGTAPATGAFNGLTYLRGMKINVNENTVRDYTANVLTGRAPNIGYKDMHDAKATLQFWIPDDMSATVNETWIIKSMLDAFNVAHDGSKWTIPNTGTSVYPGFALQSLCIETGFNKAADKRGWRLHGAVVNSASIDIVKSDKITFSMNFETQYAEKITAWTNGSATVLTAANPPLQGSQVALTWTGEDDSPAVVADFEEVHINFAHNLYRDDDIANRSGTALGIPACYIPDEFTGTGSLKVLMTTATGQKWQDIILSATVGATVSSRTIQLGQLTVTINSKLTSGKSILLTLYNVVIPLDDWDPNFAKKVELTLPFTFDYYLCQFTTADTTPPTNWDKQS